jgi:hypothetical protein
VDKLPQDRRFSVDRFLTPATLLHLFGFGANRFAFETNNRTMSLLDNQGGSVVHQLLA